MVFWNSPWSPSLHIPAVQDYVATRFISTKRDIPTVAHTHSAFVLLHFGINFGQILLVAVCTVCLYPSRLFWVSTGCPDSKSANLAHLDPLFIPSARITPFRSEHPHFPFSENHPVWSFVVHLTVHKTN